MALNFDIMERIGEDVSYRRNYAAVVHEHKNLFANYLEGKEFMVDYVWHSDIAFANFRPHNFQANERNPIIYHQVVESIWQQDTVDLFAKEDPSTARD